MLGIPLVEALAGRYPAVRLQVVEAMSGYLLEWLRDARVDLALLYVTPETRDLPGERIFREALHLIVPAGRTPPLTAQGSVTFATAAGLDLVLPGAPHGLRVLLDGAAKRAGLRLRPVMETDSYFLMRQLVVRGRACAILPPRSAAAELAHGRLATFPVAQPSLAREIAIAYATPQPPRLAVTAVGTLRRDVLAALARGGAWPGESIADR